MYTVPCLKPISPHFTRAVTILTLNGDSVPMLHSPIGLPNERKLWLLHFVVRWSVYNWGSHLLVSLQLHNVQSHLKLQWLYVHVLLACCTSRCLVGYWYFGKTYQSHLQGSNISWQNADEGSPQMHPDSSLKSCNQQLARWLLPVHMK
jgi:hypothetical protein